MAGGNPPTEPKKRSRRFYVILAAVVLLIALIVGVLLFEYSNMPNSSNVENTSYGPGPVEIEVTTDKPSYLQGEQVNFTIYVNNPHNWSVPFSQEAVHQIKEDNHIVLDLVENVDYPPGIVAAYSPRSRTSATYPWNQKINVDGNLTLAPPGNYTFTVTFYGSVDYGEGGNCTFEIRAKP